MCKRFLNPANIVLAALVVSINAACAGTDDEIRKKAEQIAHDHLIVDTHIDVPYRLRESWSDVTGATDSGNFDYPRAVQGGLDIPFMSIYTPASMEEKGGSFELANQLIDSVEAIVGRAPEHFVLVRNPAEARAAKQSGKIGLAMGMENGAPIEGKLENLRYFHDRGIRYITLTHSLNNHISDSSYDKVKKWNGLSPFGKEVVAEMNRLGIMVDVSHISDAAFYQVMEISKAPVIASHSSARHFTTGFERNMSDEMIQLLASHGGVIQINFGSSFVMQESNDWFTEMGVARTAWAKETGHSAEGPEAIEWMKTYRQNNAFPFAPLTQVADHIDHVVNLAGFEHVGFGSDFDGVGDSLPEGLKDVSAYPDLIAELMRRGYSEEQLEAIMGGNLLRVWQAVEDFSRSTHN